MLDAGQPRQAAFLLGVAQGLGAHYVHDLGVVVVAGLEKADPDLARAAEVEEELARDHRRRAGVASVPHRPGQVLARRGRRARRGGRQSVHPAGRRPRLARRALRGARPRLVTGVHTAYASPVPATRESEDPRVPLRSPSRAPHVAQIRPPSAYKRSGGIVGRAARFGVRRAGFRHLVASVRWVPDGEVACACGWTCTGRTNDKMADAWDDHVWGSKHAARKGGEGEE